MAMTEVKVNRPPFVNSEVGLKLETHKVTGASSLGTKGSDNIVPAGSLYKDATNVVYGFVYQDVDVSGGAKSASIMTGGYYNKEKLPETLSSSDETELAKHGLFSRKRGEADMTNAYNKAE
ncbi:MAG: hypothetical protein KIG33_07090 [Oscillospiraceae bacterium]|nr:hypothetical protein [Oscillospiraceae bacterium]